MSVDPFALGVFRRPGEPAFTGLVREDRVLDISELGTINDLLADWANAFKRLSEQAVAPSPNWTDLSDLKVHCPVRPAQIFQCGANYRKHVVDIVMAEYRAAKHGAGHNSDLPEAEVRVSAEAMMDDRAKTGTPYVFIGLPSALTGPHDDIVLPERGSQHDWELELAAVIGQGTVAGYTICNDITTRSLVYRSDLKAIGTDWFAAKNSPTFLPTGPYLVPAAFAGDPAALRITLKHNGVTRQDELAADMLFDVPAILAYISSVTDLWPGDLVLTGSPAGNGAHWGLFLEEGDLIEGEITGPRGQGFGIQRNRVTRKRESTP